MKRITLLISALFASQKQAECLLSFSLFMTMNIFGFMIVKSFNFLLFFDILKPKM